MHNYTKFFLEQAGFERFIKKLHSKYKSYGKIGGTIKLECLTKKEAQCLSRFFGYNMQEKENIAIPIKKFLRIMANSKYEDFDINILVEEYLNVKLTTNKDNKLSQIEKEKNFFVPFIKQNNRAGRWLKQVVDFKIKPYNLIHKRYLQNEDDFSRELNCLFELINHLPKERTLISVYAAKYTDDPHYLDLDSNQSGLFLQALANIKQGTFPQTRIEKIKLLSEFNIEIDNLSNYVITYNLLTEKSYINAFAKNNESLILNMQNILKIKKFDSQNKKVFIFENPSILNEIIEKKLNISVIIAGGFINYGVYLILDKLIENNNKLYYNGDFDPEGLIIATKLKEKYQNNIEFINYEEADYLNCISKNLLNDKRLNKLSNINDPKLQKIKNLLINHKYAGYQENNQDRIIKTINKKNKY